MGIELNADEIFEMAEQIERDAAAFYTRAAALATSNHARQLFQKLADMENDHILVFQTMKAHLNAHGWTSSKNEPDQPLKSNWALLAMLSASGVGQDLENRFSGKHTSEELIRIALEFEKDTIIFFLSMQQMLSRPGDRKRIDALIKEELGHVLSLTTDF